MNKAQCEKVVILIITMGNSPVKNAILPNTEEGIEFHSDLYFRFGDTEMA